MHVLRDGRRTGSRRHGPLATTLALVVLAPVACTAGEAPRPLRSAVLILLDTLRADHVSAYGYERLTTPALDALAEEGVLFEAAISNSSWTLPSVAGLLSGRVLTASVFDRTLRTSLVETIRDAGIATAAFTEGGNFSSAYELNRGFTTYREEEGDVRRWIHGRFYRESANGGVDHTFEGARRWLREHAGERFFLLVHTYETHAPYRRQHFAAVLDSGALGEGFEPADSLRARRGEIPIGATEIEYLTALYDGGARVADRHVGELLTVLDELDLADETLVVVMSDHGEDLGARFPRFAGSHGHTLYDGLVRVPLIMRVPGRAVPIRKVTSQVRTIDVMPTVFDLLGLPAVAVDGRSLVPVMQGVEREHRVAVSRLTAGPDRPSRVALRDGTHKLIVNKPAGEPRRPALELYDLDADPGERRNLARLRPGLVRRLRTRLTALLEPVRTDGEADFREPEDLTDEQRERLRSLGYAD